MRRTPLRGVEVFMGRHLTLDHLADHTDRRKNRSFFRLVDRLYRSALQSCLTELERDSSPLCLTEVERDFGERDGLRDFGETAKDFRRAMAGGMQYAPGRLTHHWTSMGAPGSDAFDQERRAGVPSEYYVQYCNSPVRNAITYEDYLACKLLMLYTELNEGVAHVRRPPHPASAKRLGPSTVRSYRD